MGPAGQHVGRLADADAWGQVGPGHPAGNEVSLFWGQSHQQKGFRLRPGLQERAPCPYNGAWGILQGFENSACSCSPNALAGLTGGGATVLLGSRDTASGRGEWLARAQDEAVVSGEGWLSGSGKGRGAALHTLCDLRWGEVCSARALPRAAEGGNRTEPLSHPMAAPRRACTQPAHTLRAHAPSECT